MSPFPDGTFAGLVWSIERKDLGAALRVTDGVNRDGVASSVKVDVMRSVFTLTPYVRDPAGRMVASDLRPIVAMSEVPVSVGASARDDADARVLGMAILQRLRS